MLFLTSVTLLVFRPVLTDLCSHEDLKVLASTISTPDLTSQCSYIVIFRLYGYLSNFT